MTHTPAGWPEPPALASCLRLLGWHQASSCSDGGGAQQLYDAEAGSSRAPAPADDSQCVPNDAAKSKWKEDENAAYTNFWIVVIFVVVAVIAAALLVALRTGSGDGTEDGLRNARAGKIKKVVASVLVGLRTLDLATDWGFFSLSVQTPRFKYLMENDGLSHPGFETASLLFSVLATLLYVPDLYALYWKHIAHVAAKPPPLSSVVITILVTVSEDVPQFFLSVVYLDVTRRADAAMCDRFKEGVDGLAVFSLLMSTFSIVLNLLSVFMPRLFYNVADEKTGKRLERVSDPLGRRMSSVRRSTKGKPVDRGVVFDNPMYDAAPAAAATVNHIALHFVCVCMCGVCVCACACACACACWAIASSSMSGYVVGGGLQTCTVPHCRDVSRAVLHATLARLRSCLGRVFGRCSCQQHTDEGRQCKEEKNQRRCKDQKGRQHQRLREKAGCWVYEKSRWQHQKSDIRTESHGQKSHENPHQKTWTAADRSRSHEKGQSTREKSQSQRAGGRGHRIWCVMSECPPTCVGRTSTRQRHVAPATMCPTATLTGDPPTCVGRTSTRQRHVIHFLRASADVVQK